MRLLDLGPLPLSIIVSLLVAVLLLAIRVFVMQRIQSQRQRENRQETERLKSLVAAYRSLAGSFTPAREEHREQLEETLADLVLFGSLHEVELAARCARGLVRGEPVAYQPLIEALRADVRSQLGLAAIPASLELPASGPGRRAARSDGEGSGRAAGGGAGGGGGLGGAAGAGGLGAGMIAGDAAHHPDT
ncbi:MAG TPA: hypothetical protein VL994_10980 [Steroidobacteraceae bacterium]|nr:hypothetical protein [Steroidobacteraceae bacterium]